MEMESEVPSSKVVSLSFQSAGNSQHVEKLERESLNATRLAQEIEKEFPELVNINDGNYTVAYSKLSVLILKALQEQEKQIDALEQEINLLLAAQSK